MAMGYPAGDVAIQQLIAAPEAPAPGSLPQGTAAAMASSGRTDDPQNLRLMQFNIRTGYADWGMKTAWQPALGLLPLRMCRRSACAACIAEHAPDVVATQEGLLWQMRHLEKDLHGRYSSLGRGRGTHWFDDETSAILYDKTRWQAEATGDFMLSPTPKVWGSAYEGYSWPMITTWAVLVGQSSRAGQRLLVISTHLDPCSPEVRTKSSKQILVEAERLRTELNCQQAFLLGDFNCDCLEETYTMCSASGWGDALFRLEGPYAPGSFTYHDFLGPAWKMPPGKVGYTDQCMDFVMTWPATLEVTYAVVDKRRYGPGGPDENGVYPSDHYAVVADVRLLGSKA